MIGDAIKNFFNELIFDALNILGAITDTIIKLMRMLLGLDPLHGTDATSNLVENILGEERVIMTFLCVFALGIISAFAFAIIRIVRNGINDDKDDGAVSKNKAVKGAAMSIVNMLLIPVFAFTLVFAVTGIAKTLDNATSENNTLNYGTEIIFSIVDKNGLTQDGIAEYDKTSCDKCDFQGTGMTLVKHKWDAHDRSYSYFTNLVNKDAYFGNFLLPLLGGCVMVFSLGMACIIAGQRLFICTFLFVVSPFIAAIRPMDDGARWRRWCEIFMSKLMGSFGIITALNIFFMLSGSLFSLQFFDDSMVLENGIAKLVIYISGVIAATGASQLVAQLIGSDAGTQERDQAMNNYRNVMAGMGVATGIVRNAGRLTRTAGNFFAGKKTTPLNAMEGATGLTASTLGGGTATPTVATNMAGGGVSSMAATIGNVMLGRTSAGEVAKNAGHRIGNSRIGKVAKGAGILAAGTVALPARLAKKGIDAVKPKKYNPAMPETNLLDKKADERGSLMQKHVAGLDDKAKDLKNDKK